ncbi:hypothetical protein AO391_25560 [Pseudomonas marginalis ICMP 9505]|nr:hypothetical protein AO391_25560 [Pseudomonas marginalis ICMP 9505]
MGQHSHFDQEFHDDIQDLLDEGHLEEGSKQHGIALFARDNGYECLSGSQKNVFDRFVLPPLKRRKQQLEHQRIIDSNPD